MKFWLLTLSMLTTAAQGGTPWAWLNDEIPEIRAQQAQIQARLAILPPAPAPQTHVQAGFHSGFAPEASTVRWVQVDLGREYELEAVVVVPASLGGTGPYGFPHHFRVDASNDALFADSTTLLNHSQGQGSAETSLAPWHMPARGVKARYVRFTASQLAGQPRLEKRYIFCLGELLVFSGGRNVALHAEVLAPNSVETLPTWSPRHLVDGYHALGLPVWPDNVQGNGWHSAIFTTADATCWVQADLGQAREIQEIRLIPSHPRDYPDRPGFGLPPRFKVEADARIIFDSTSADFPNPGNMPVVIPTPGLRAQTLRITATRLFERSSDFVFSLAELQAFTEGGQNIALGATVTSSDETLTPSWSHEGLVDGRSSSGRLMDEAAWLEGLSDRRQKERQLADLTFELEMETFRAIKRAVYLVIAVLATLLVAAFLLLLRFRRSRRQEMEALRHRISRDLHDEIGSHLGSIRLMSELALREQGASESLEEIHRLAGEAAESMRGIIWLVREGDSPRLSSLAEAMRQSAAVLLKGSEWTLQAPTSDDTTTASLEFHRQVFLFFREAVHNIARHAQAMQTTIEIQWTAKRFTLHIQDNGIGFDPQIITTGNGLANLRHRIDVLKGTLKIESASSQGTHIHLEAPLA